MWTSICRECKKAKSHPTKLQCRGLLGHTGPDWRSDSRESQGRERERKEDKVRKRERGEEEQEQEQEQERRRGMDGQRKAFKDKGLVADTAQGPGRVDAAPGTGAGASNSDAHAPQHLWACPLCGKDFSHVHSNARQVCATPVVHLCLLALACQVLDDCVPHALSAHVAIRRRHVSFKKHF
jgi:hypothetical protein